MVLVLRLAKRHYAVFVTYALDSSTIWEINGLKQLPKALSEQSAVKYHARCFPFDLNEDAMWEIIRAGGGFMWPIILCSIAAVAIILERLWTLQSSRVIPRDLAQKVWNWIEADQLSDKLVLALEQNSPLGKLLAIGIANRNKPRALMVERLEDGGRHVIHDLERFLNTLGTIAAIAPLLGLLGTVAGIIHAFNAITASGLGDPRTLSGGIGEALITTAAGLTVAIPSLIAYRYLRGKVERLVIRMEKEAMKLVDALDERGGVLQR
jgi:biopolymer transport protein ExbB